MNLFSKFPKFSYSKFLFENKKAPRKDKIKALNYFLYCTRENSKIKNVSKK